MAAVSVMAGLYFPKDPYLYEISRAEIAEATMASLMGKPMKLYLTNDPTNTPFWLVVEQLRWEPDPGRNHHWQMIVRPIDTTTLARLRKFYPATERFDAGPADTYTSKYTN